MAEVFDTISSMLVVRDDTMGRGVGVTGEIIGTSRGGDDDQGRGSEEAGEGGGDIGGART
jgi:hypothetical protein